MKVLVILLALITATLQSGEAAVRVRIRAYDASGEIDIGGDGFTLGSRVLLTCDVEELPAGSEVVSYKWEYYCTGGRCEIQEGAAYRRAVNDTLLVDVTSSLEPRYYCVVEYQNAQGTSYTMIRFTTLISVTGSSIPYLFTTTSILLNHTLITDFQQVIGRDRQHSIKCSGGDGGGSYILLAMSGRIIAQNYTNTATIRLQDLSNGLYYCWSGQSTRKYFSLYVRNSTTLPTPTVLVQNTMWIIVSPDSSPVERYIVEFECRVRNITFVEKYMSVSANSGGTGPVVASDSCFGGLGRLYRVKVWAVSGPNISRRPAVKCLTSAQCREEGSRGTPTPTTVAATSAITDLSPSNTSKPTDRPSTIGVSIGVGSGVGVVLVLAFLTMVGLVLLIVVAVRKAPYKLKRDEQKGDNLYYNNTIVVKQEIDLTEKGLGADYDDVNNDKGEEKGSIVDGYHPYEDADSKAQIKTAMKSASEESPTPLRETIVVEMHTVVDKTKKKGARTEEREDESAVTKNDDLYAMPMKKKVRMTDRGNGVVESGDVEEGESDDMLGLQYEPMADSETGQQIEGKGKVPDVDMLYAVVDKSHKKKK